MFKARERLQTFIMNNLGFASHILKKNIFVLTDRDKELDPNGMSADPCEHSTFLHNYT